MAKRRFEMFQYRQVIHRMRMGESDRAIAKSGLMGRVKCGFVRARAQERGWLRSEVPLPDDAELAIFLTSEAPSNRVQPSLSRPYEEKIKKWSEEGICWTTIHETLVDQFGFQGSYSSVRRLAQRLRRENPRVTCILDFAPGEAAQVDFGKGPTITDVFTGEVIPTWVFVMTLCFSRHIYAELVANQKVETWLGCHRRAFEHFNGVPSRLIIDNPKCAITRACFHDPEVQRSYGALAEGYGFLISPCPPAEPEKKGRVEAGVKYVKNRFLPLRSFRSLADGNTQLMRWVMGTAGNRVHGTTKQKPLTLFAETERYRLKPLPDVPVEMATWAQAKVHGDCHIRFEKAFYSAPFRLVHQSLWLRVTDTTVKLYHDLGLVAVHPRLRKPGDRSTVEDHLPPEAVAYRMQDPQWCLKQAEGIGPSCHELVQQLFDDRVLDRLRAAQGIIALAKRYGTARLERACSRALFFQNLRYRAIKSILEQGLDQLPSGDPRPKRALASTYTETARFLRPAADFGCI